VLVVHGVLHLLGFDHAEPADETEMFARQAELVSAHNRS
jgi:probable rRNA maturation factor